MLPCRAHRHGSPPASKFPGTRTSGPFQTVEIVADDPPDRVRVNTVISMVKYISETSDRLPRLLRRQRFGITLQSPSGFADDQERVQDRVKRLLVSAESREIEPRCEPLDADDIVEDVLEAAGAPSEGKHGLFFDGAPQPLLADRLGHDIDRASEDIADASGQRLELAEILKAAGRG